MIAGYADVREGLFDYLAKPFDDLESLEATIDKALELDRAYREIDSLRHTLDGRAEGLVLIGRSAAIERLPQQIRQVAPLDTSVLLEGESGTGKDVAGRILHAGSSPRRAAPRPTMPGTGTATIRGLAGTSPSRYGLDGDRGRPRHRLALSVRGPPSNPRSETKAPSHGRNHRGSAAPARPGDAQRARWPAPTRNWPD